MRPRLRVRKKGRKTRALTRKKRPHIYVLKKKRCKQVDLSYNQGFDSGYDEAIKKLNSMIVQPDNVQQHSGEDEYRKGLYDGGDGIVNAILPDLEILPHSIREIIEAGVEQLRPQIHKLLGAAEVGQRIEYAMNNNSPLSVVRLGD